jgi:hypothetical protein
MTNANAGFATVTVVANAAKATVATGSGVAALAAIANQPSISLRANAANTQVTAVSNIPTVTKAVVGNAGNAAVILTANGPVAFIKTGSGLAIVGVVAGDASNFVPEPLESPPFIIRNREGLSIQNSSDAFIIRDGP